MKIGIDIDDTIAKSYEAMKVALLEESNYLISDDILYYHDPMALDYYSRNSDEMTLKLEVKEDAVEVINKLKDEGYEIYFITARNNKYYKDAYGSTYKWLIDKGFKFDKLIIDSKYKDIECEKLGITHFIDDSIDHVNSIISKNIKGYIFTSYYNRKFDLDNRVNNWKEVYELIKGSE